MIIVLISMCRMKSTILKKKKELFKELGVLYKTMMDSETKNLPTADLVELKKNLKNMLKENLKIIKNTEMEMFEKKIILHYFKIPEIDDTKSFHSDSDDQTQKQNEIMMVHSNTTRESEQDHLLNLNTNNEDRLTQPLLSIIGGDSKKKEMERRLSHIRDNSDPNSDDCIICFSSLENFSGALKFMCGHRFHSDCIFDWLKINPTCPMCRRNFRVDLINRMIKDIDHMIRIQNENNV